MKSMRRVSRGRSFLGLMTYLLRRDAEHRQQPGVPIGGTVCGTTARDMARELRSAAQQRPDIIRPVWHQALRLPQGERLPPLTWCRIAEVFMEEMGFDTAQQPYAVVLHDDPQGQHIHIAASRVGMDGRIYLGQNENLRASRLVIELEKRFGLQRAPASAGRAVPAPRAAATSVPTVTEQPDTRPTSLFETIAGHHRAALAAAMCIIRRLCTGTAFPHCSIPDFPPDMCNVCSHCRERS